MTPELVITRGLPASGKTTFARAWVAEDREHCARVNRDDIRAMLDDGEFVKDVTEPRVLAARDAAILTLLRKGVSVVCDETCLPQRAARDLARQAGATLEVKDFTHVGLDTCLARNARRTGKAWVPPERIREMHDRYIAEQELPLPWPREPADGPAEAALYEPKPGTPRAVLCDIDGTVALMGMRHAFDETRVHEDRPNLPVITVVRAMYAAGHQVVFMSGRSAGCRPATYEWLNTHVGIPFAGLHMREAGDYRKDSVVKRELFDRHIREHYDVACVIDDRASVIRMWREELGLTCLAVAEGNF